MLRGADGRLRAKTQNINMADIDTSDIVEVKLKKCGYSSLIYQIIPSIMLKRGTINTPALNIGWSGVVGRVLLLDVGFSVMSACTALFSCMLQDRRV